MLLDGRSAEPGVLPQPLGNHNRVDAGDAQLLDDAGGRVFGIKGGEPVRCDARSLHTSAGQPSGPLPPSSLPPGIESPMTTMRYSPLLPAHAERGRGTSLGVVVRQGEGIFATGANCTHYGGPLAEILQNPR